MCKQCPPVVKPFEFVLIFQSLNMAHHFLALAMTLNNPSSALGWKTYTRVFSGEVLITEGKGKAFQSWKVKTVEVFHQT